MSITFSIAANPTGQFRLSPSCAFADEPETKTAATQLAATVHATYEDATIALMLHKETCKDCAHYGCFTESVLDVESDPAMGIESMEDIEVNLANANALYVAQVCGFSLRDPEDGSLVGSMDAATLSGHVLTALALLGTDGGYSDTVIGDVDLSRTGNGSVIACGLPAGYLARTLGRLADLATHAQRLDRPIWWS